MQVSLLQKIDEWTRENNMSLTSPLDDPHPIPVPSMLQHARLCRIPTLSGLAYQKDRGGRYLHSFRHDLVAATCLWVWRPALICPGHTAPMSTLANFLYASLTILWGYRRGCGFTQRSNPKTLVLSTKDYIIA